MPKQTEKYADLFKTEYFSLTRILLVAIGRWPFVSARMKKLFTILALILLLSGAPFAVTEIIHLWNGDRKKIAALLAPLLTCSISLTKYFNFSVHHISILTLITRMYDNWKRAVGEEQKIFIIYGEYAKSMSKLYTKLIYTSMIIFLLMPLTPVIADVIKPLNVSRPRRLVFPVRYSEEMGPENCFVILTIHCATAAVTSMSIIIASDVFFINLVSHACCLFAVAKHWLEHLHDGIPDLLVHFHTFNVDNHAHEPELTKLCIKRIAYAVTWHNKALNYAFLVQDTFTTSLLLILSCNMILISFTGFQILTQNDSWDEILLGLTYIFGQLCHLYLLSLPGQLLIDESGSIRDSITQSYSFDFPVKAQKMLIIILMRALHTSKITAGKFFVLEMETFMSVLQASMSYFTVLANFS